MSPPTVRPEFSIGDRRIVQKSQLGQAVERILGEAQFGSAEATEFLPRNAARLVQPIHGAYYVLLGRVGRQAVRVSRDLVPGGSQSRHDVALRHGSAGGRLSDVGVPRRLDRTTVPGAAVGRQWTVQVVRLRSNGSVEREQYEQGHVGEVEARGEGRCVAGGGEVIVREAATVAAAVTAPAIRPGGLGGGHGRSGGDEDQETARHHFVPSE
mmetsp:Transcript_31063/g.57395  ORF Transcript_31063/g.57395 Transcript_31063/m.57395 type:complete len:211 (-) Transcript_31063:9-641(-)